MECCHTSSTVRNAERFRGAQPCRRGATLFATARGPRRRASAYFQKTTREFVMRSGVMSKTTLALTISLLLCRAGFAQTTSGSIAGSVVDSQHAALPNAAVTAREQQQQFTVST